MSARKIAVLLVDDHEVVRLGLRTLLGRERTIEVVGEAGTAGEPPVNVIPGGQMRCESPQGRGCRGRALRALVKTLAGRD